MMVIEVIEVESANGVMRESDSSAIAAWCEAQSQFANVVFKLEMQLHHTTHSLTHHHNIA